MTKTPEQMAEEWLENRKAYSSCIDNATRIRLQAQAREGFLAGYQAAKDEYETKIQELEIQLENWQHNAIHGDEGL